MDAELRSQVRDRARNRCEYCHLHEQHDFFQAFHMEHIVARQHRGATKLENLAWSCLQCNLHKGTNLSGIDPDTNELVRLFNPRTDRWVDHFRLDGPIIKGLTAIGRTTTWLLQMNAEDRLELRRALLDLGELE